LLPRSRSRSRCLSAFATAAGGSVFVAAGAATCSGAIEAGATAEFADTAGVRACAGSTAARLEVIAVTPAAEALAAAVDADAGVLGPQRERTRVGGAAGKDAGTGAA
jgi:hypothetical protein